MWKWLLRKLTGKCELLRITYSEPAGAYRTRLIEHSITHSKSVVLSRLTTQGDGSNLEDIVTDVMRVKDIVPEVHPGFQTRFLVSLQQIVGYAELVCAAEELRRLSFNNDDARHLDMLMQLWKVLQPGVTLSGRISKQWSDIGFQGDDPKTDFRGMGMLGLHDLVYFASKHPESARHALSHSNHPQFGYSFAIVGINLTELTLSLLLSGVLKNHFYNSVSGKPTLENLHQVYCHVFCEFDKFWMAEKPNIMEFGSVRERFKRQLIDKLLVENATLLL